MKNILTITLILLSLGAFSQDVLLRQNVKADSIRPTFGPNLKNYVHAFVGLGFPFSTNQSSNYTKPGASTNFDFGVRYKRKFTNFLAMGLDLGINSASYKIKQNDSKTVPDNVINDKEKIQVNSMVSSAWLRINIGRRGNFIGNYLDLGAYGGWNYQKKHKTVNTNTDDEKIKVSTSKLKYIENFSDGVMARVGASRYSLTANYRLSELFKPSSAMPELPRLIIGVEVGLFGK